MLLELGKIKAKNIKNYETKSSLENDPKKLILSLIILLQTKILKIVLIILV
ncbi:MAG: hypothetical protein MRERC_7c066 [Mycoplasmataceae bacterium RC_NB112A]|nr:MAG: hypothetical protein MRERC_8c065 [Mycoplasmataceae bacterium RC_NB112A]KLL01901.1 MAG: hypothetical protein MRERC_7c066 [Mycoplasmataceae bacterium RC_NB112A]